MKNKHALLALIAIITLVLDQIIKNILIAKGIFWFSPWKWLNIQTNFNHGIAFSLSFPIIPLIIISTTIISAVIASWICYKTKTYLQTLGVGLFIGGALGNLLDRILHKAVVDYLNVFTSSLNLADTAIIAGIIVLIFSTGRRKSDLQKEN